MFGELPFNSQLTTTAQASDTRGPIPAGVSSSPQLVTTPQPLDPKALSKVPTGFAQRSVQSLLKDRTDQSERLKAPSTEARSSVQVWTTPIQIWEGVVQRVDKRFRTMHVTLTAKIGSVSDHTGEIDLQWVAEQDLELVQPGAVFYWTIYKEKKHGSVRNSQVLRFRRVPTWSKTQLARLRSDAAHLLSRAKIARQYDSSSL